MGTIDSTIIGYEIRNANNLDILYEEYKGYHPSSLLTAWWYYYDKLGYDLDLVKITEGRHVEKTNYDRLI